MQHQNAMRRYNSGNFPNCSHPRTEREFYLGSATGDYVCTTCGECWSRTDPARPQR